ncbi:hypothetical protein S7711_10524 [Stachybotrys chartarum IBT 7711]|uniref:Uncharacterized protein n=1 Tax=Stachybotrys chartarum (strain CBS 109288 / IBT 7711) TaxID=1280523 RepID=A0A084AMP5_STACB|nr:hypothetical protein S7711_10524 [Stachybotrys chartarum IBT 7711]
MVGQYLVRQAREMLIVEREAFAPGSWEDQDSDGLFTAHNEEPSNLANFVPGGVLPRHEEPSDEKWDTTKGRPDWARDWSYTYLLHAFTPTRWGHEVPGFEHISSRYVLERQSNFARAVYPVARKLHEEGLLDIDDSYLGHEGHYRAWYVNVTG